MTIPILDSVLGPLLALPPLLSIVVISGIISSITIVAYKFFTDQSLMKDLRNEIKELQEELKELKNKPEKAMKVQTRMMETNMKYMSESMKPTLFTFIPIILIFGWLNSHMAYYPVTPGVPFEVSVYFETGADGEITMSLPEELTVKETLTKDVVGEKVTWYVSGPAGEYNLTFEYKGRTYDKQVLITQERRYISPVKKIKDSPVTQIVVGNKPVKPFANIPIIQNIPWVSGWGWLGTYILFSIIFSMSLRRLLKIY